MARHRLRALVAKQAEAKPPLPYVHTTDVYRFINALDDGLLVPRPCTVFVGEPLLYFFYGRPSYRVNANELPSALSHYLPVCLLFRNGSVRPIKRVFPFDTGGFATDLYADAFHKDMNLEDFGLAPDPATPGRVISLFFGSAEDYLLARPLSSVPVAPTELEALSYHALISQRLSNNLDNRVSGIEIQFEGNLPLTGNIEAVVAPGPILDDDQIRGKLVSARATAIPYPQIDRQRPSEYVTKVFDLCAEYYRRIRLIR